MKKMLSAYMNAWRSILKYRWPILFLYLANLVFTFVVTSPYTNYFKTKMQESEVLDATEGFDISMVLEFLNNHGDGLSPLLILIFIIFIFYFLFSVYANAGILYAVVSRNSYIALRPFWNGGLNYFWKVLRLSIYYLLGLGLVIFLTWNVLLKVGINILEVASDNELILKVRIGLVFVLVVGIVFSLIRQYSKIYIAVKNHPFITGAIMNSSTFVFRNFLMTFSLYLLNIVILLVISVLFYKIRGMMKIDLWMMTFFAAQIYLLAKIVIRIVHMHSVFELYKKVDSSEVLSDN